MNPKSLFGRMLLVLLFGLVIGQLLSAAVYLYERQNILFNAVWTQAAQGLRPRVKVLEAAPSAERERFAALLSGTPYFISTTDHPHQADDIDAGDADFLKQILRQYLGEGREIRVFSIDRNQFFGIDNASFGVNVKLSDGNWVTFRFNYSKPNRYLSRRLFIDLMIISSILFLLSFFAVRWVTRPLKLLAHAADELGENINRPPLPTDGPLEVSLAARAFNAMQSRLQEYLQTRARIHAALSHDLKTPITRMILRAELLDDSELKSKFIKDLEEMDSMVTTHLDLMRGLGNGEATRPVDIDTLIGSIQEDQAELSRQVSVAGSAKSNYFGKPQALKRAITNLVENAVKYGKQADILIEDSELELTIHVTDQGPGIPENELARVCEPFYRLEQSRSRETGGSGLGLAIAQGIAQIHGGRLTLKNRRQGGLDAILSLPRQGA